jgi:hypothetical protein
MLKDVPGVQWKLVSASTNSPLQVEAEAVSFEPSVDVTVVARTQKHNLARNLEKITRGEEPTDPDFKVAAARRVFARNLNGVGATDIDLEIGQPILITPRVARQAVDALAKKPSELFEAIGARDEIGTVEGTLSDVGTHYNIPAAKILDVRGREVWCRLSPELQETLQDKARYKDVWHHSRVFVRGRIKYGSNGDVLYVVANDIRRVQPREITLDEIRDPNFTGGLPIGEYLDRFRDGALG